MKLHKASLRTSFAVIVVIQVLVLAMYLTKQRHVSQREDIFPITKVIQGTTRIPVLIPSTIQIVRKRSLLKEEVQRIVQRYFQIEALFSINSTHELQLPNDTGTIVCKDYNLTNPTHYVLADLPTAFDSYNGTIACYSPGTDSCQRNGSRFECRCKSDYTGLHCSVPLIVSDGLRTLSRSHTVVPRPRPRRLILAMTFNMEHYVLMLKLLQIQSAVDLFVILESNYTGYGTPRPLYFLHNLRRGFMRRFQHKIMHVFLDTFAPGGRQNGWLAEAYIRKHLAPAIEQRVSGIRKDDLYVFMDADETPSVVALEFLKNHDGYPFPVGFNLQPFFYGFFWTIPRTCKRVVAVCTMQMLHDVYNMDSDSVRGGRGLLNRLKKGKLTRDIYQTWHIGSASKYAGWHASWFSTPGEVITKLVSAINADLPRWGDYPEKRKYGYVVSLFRRGIYFNEQLHFHPILFRDVYVLKEFTEFFQNNPFFNFMIENPTRI